MSESAGEMISAPERDQEIAQLRDRAQRLERQLIRMHRLATLGTLAGSVAHEFNNILTPVLSYAQLAMASPDDSELSAKALRKAADGTERAAKIASSMLGFIREGESDSSCSVRSVIEDTLGCLARDPAKDGIDVVIDAPVDLQVRISPIALQQVLLNLVLNAIEAIRPKQGRIEIRASRSERSTWNTSGETAGGVEIHVRDSGRGVPLEILDRVFEPLVSARFDEGSRRGTGLGLSICRTLIQEASGSIELQSAPNEGSTFTITLAEAEAIDGGAQKAA